MSRTSVYINLSIFFVRNSRVLPITNSKLYSNIKKNRYRVKILKHYSFSTWKRIDDKVTASIAFISITPLSSFFKILDLTFKSFAENQRVNHIIS